MRRQLGAAPGPVFWRNDAAGVCGPGHNGFFKSPDGTEDWIVYHGKTTAAYTYACRTTRAQKITWNADGTPNFGRPSAAGATRTCPRVTPAPPTTGSTTPTPTVSLRRCLELRIRLWQPVLLGQRPLEQRGQRDRHHPLHRQQAALLSVADVGNGIAAISIDGGPEQRVDYYSSIRVGEQLSTSAQPSRMAPTP